MKTLSTRTSQYRIIEFLGEGLNSCVYRAFKESADLDVRFEVALKILNSEKKVAIWRNEFERLAKIRSPYCVSLFGWEKVGSAPALVLEFVEGLTLAELIKREVLTVDIIDEIAAQILRGLKDLADAGLFHGDLNLYNIMVNLNGGVKLVDFGVLGDVNDIMTTPKYAAPEVLQGVMPSYQTDVFSLQCIRHELIYNLKHPARNGPINDLDALQSHLARRIKLSTVVKRALLAKKIEKVKTKTMRLKQVLSDFPKRRWLRWLAVSAALSASILVYGDQLKTKPNMLAKVSFRTRSWYQIYIGNEVKGYSPLDLVLPANQTHEIHWQKQGLKGKRTLTLRPGQHIVLSDEFFGQ